MEIELERTFLVKKIPKDLEKCESVEIFDKKWCQVYFLQKIKKLIEK